MVIDQIDKMKTVLKFQERFDILASMNIDVWDYYEDLDIITELCHQKQYLPVFDENLIQVFVQNPNGWKIDFRFCIIESMPFKFMMWHHATPIGVNSWIYELFDFGELLQAQGECI